MVNSNINNNASTPCLRKSSARGNFWASCVSALVAHCLTASVHNICRKSREGSRNGVWPPPRVQKTRLWNKVGEKCIKIGPKVAQNHPQHKMEHKGHQSAQKREPKRPRGLQEGALRRFGYQKVIQNQLNNATENRCQQRCQKARNYMKNQTKKGEEIHPEINTKLICSRQRVFDKITIIAGVFA